MAIYILIYSLLTITVLGSTNLARGTTLNRYRDYENQILIFFIILLVMIQALRSSSVGGDLFDNYARGYRELGLLRWDDIRTYTGHSEIGYVLFNKIVFTLTNGNIQAFLFFISLSLYIPLTRLFIKYSNNNIFSLFIFVGLGLFNVSMNNLRSTIALGVILWGLSEVIEGKRLKFLIYIAIASLFHTTALVFLVFEGAIIIKNVKFKIAYFAGITLLFTVGFSIFSRTLIRYIPRYSSYFTMDISGSGYNYLMFLIIILCFCVLYPSRERFNNNADIWIQLLICATLMQTISLRISYFVRAVNYLVIGVSVLIPISLENAENRRLSPLVIFMIVIGFWGFYMLSLTGNSTQTVPYAFFWGG